ncbi:MAG: enoyl-CoA hydratase/isomerase family protein [Candidatus Bathyarchaeota archaeon]|nr:enoyl-CoA hydratase/isomerase family protein [Candidatus Bathyarchaeum sp.]
MSSSYKTIKLKNKQHIAWIILDRADKLNAINSVMLQELSNALDMIEKDENTRCVIFVSNGEKAFSAGADLTELCSLTPETAAQFSIKGQQVFTKIEACSKPVIAAIKGYALGGGLELALACDFRIASDNAELGCPEIKLGLVPAWGATQRLPAVVGVSNAKQLIMTGDTIQANEALKIGLVDKVVPSNELEADVEGLAQKLVKHSPVALKYAKLAVNSVAQSLFDCGLKKETEDFALLFSEKETKERIEAFVSQRNKK